MCSSLLLTPLTMFSAVSLSKAPNAPPGIISDYGNSGDLKRHTAVTAVIKVKVNLVLELNTFIWHLTGAILN